MVKCPASISTVKDDGEADPASRRHCPRFREEEARSRLSMASGFEGWWRCQRTRTSRIKGDRLEIMDRIESAFSTDAFMPANHAIVTPATVDKCTWNLAPFSRVCDLYCRSSTDVYEIEPLPSTIIASQRRSDSISIGKWRIEAVYATRWWTTLFPVLLEQPSSKIFREI